MSKFTKSEQGRLNKRQGAVGQSVAVMALRRLGVLMPEQIATPVILRPAHPSIPGKPMSFYVTYGEKVSGDHRGILPDGRSVLAETKSMHGDRLKFSDLLPHQPGRLTEHAQAGGLSLLIWASDYGTFVMRWPVPDFKKGKSIKVDQARNWDLESLPAVPHFDNNEINLFKGWFESLQDTHPGFLEAKDYELAVKLYEALGVRVPASVRRGALTTQETRL